MGALLWTAGKAFFICLVLTPIVRDISRSYYFVDRPGTRKVHAHPIPRVGGIAIAIAYALALISLPGSASPAIGQGLDPWKVAPAAAMVFAVGLLDDLLSLRPLVKLAGLAGAATLAFWSGLHMGNLSHSALPVWIDYPLTVFWLLLASNALNLIDGLDGLCAGMGLLSALTLFTAAMLAGNHGLAYVTFPLAGALAGFLCYNFNPATVFLGDSGALLVGFLLGAYGMYWTQKGSTLLSMLVPLLALSIPLLDVSLSVLRRAMRGAPIFTGDRGHIHHRLLDRGLSPRRAVLVLYLVGALAAAFALAASTKFGGNYSGPIVVAFCVTAFLGVRKLRYAEFSAIRRSWFGLGAAPDAEPADPLAPMRAALESAEPGEWFAALAQECKALGLTSVRWTAGGVVHEETLAQGAKRGWSLQIPLSGNDVVQLEGVSGESEQAFDTRGLAAIVERTCPAGESRGAGAGAA
jgi:UDP-GlcNAc:undecaprenyl-phosphate/decaprenyl-phosphate GlcNAc-1-phosphate transferase